MAKRDKSLSMEGDVGNVGARVVEEAEDNAPYLSNLNEDPALSHILKYRLRPGLNLVGCRRKQEIVKRGKHRGEGEEGGGRAGGEGEPEEEEVEEEKEPEICLGGLGVAEEHAVIVWRPPDRPTIHAVAGASGRTCLNGSLVTAKGPRIGGVEEGEEGEEGGGAGVVELKLRGRGV